MAAARRASWDELEAIAVLGAVAVVEPLFPCAMGFAAGAMLFVISDGIIPETHRSGHERVATLGLVAGVIVVLHPDIALTGYPIGHRRPVVRRVGAADHAD